MRGKIERIHSAAKNMDWQQVVLNGGPPCFHLCGDGSFCGRAERWEGHRVMYSGDKALHKFVSLADLIKSIHDESSREIRKLESQIDKLESALVDDNV